MRASNVLVLALWLAVFMLCVPGVLAGSGKNPTKQPTTLSPTVQVTEIPTASPTGIADVAEIPSNNNDAQAVATLVGSTVPFLGLGGIAVGIYMIRKRRRSISFPKNEVPTPMVVTSHVTEQQHVSTKNPAFSGPANNDDPENPFQNGDTNWNIIPPSIMGIGTDDDNMKRSSNRKTPRSLMSMVLKSRETASFYKSPLDYGEEKESGLSKEQIEEKIRRQAALGARGYGTSTSGVGLKPLGRVISIMRTPDPARESVLRPSEVAERETTLPPMNFSSIPPPPPLETNASSFAPHSNFAPSVPPFETKPSASSFQSAFAFPSPQPQERRSEAVKSFAFPSSASAAGGVARESIQTARESMQSMVKSVASSLNNVPSFKPTKYIRKSTMFDGAGSVRMPSMHSAFRSSAANATSAQLDPKNSTNKAAFRTSNFSEIMEEKADDPSTPRLDIAKPPPGFTATLPSLAE